MTGLMWISVVPVKKLAVDLLLPRGLWPEAPSYAWLQYGLRQARITLASAATSPGGNGQTPDAPARVYISMAAMNKLLIRPEPVYRLRILSGDRFEIGPVLGLLLGDRSHWYHHDYLFRDPERVTIPYRETGGLYCAFSARSYSSFDQCIYGLWYHPQQRRWRFGVLPLPSVLHRRSFSATAQRTVRRLLSVPGLTVFNGYRFDKWETYQLLKKDSVLRRHLPETGLVDHVDVVLRQLDRWGSVILKPSNLSRGRGIFIVRSTGIGETGPGDSTGPMFTLTDYRQRSEPLSRDISLDDLSGFITSQLLSRQYICQHKIELATFFGNPFDIRVVMQKGPAGEWQCTGIECRVAKSGSLITNLSMGGTAHWLYETVTQAFNGRIDPGALEQRLIGLCRRVCMVFDKTGHCFGELALDAALDRRGGIWFLEANVIPDFQGFKALDMSIYHNILAMPMRYANYLAGFGRVSSTEHDEHHEGVD